MWLYEQKNKTKKDFDFWFRSDHSTTTSLGRSNVLFDNDVVVVFQLMTEKKDQLMIINPPYKTGVLRPLLRILMKAKGREKEKRSIATRTKWRGGWWWGGRLTDTCYCRLWNIERGKKETGGYPLLFLLGCWRVLMALLVPTTTITKEGDPPLFLPSFFLLFLSICPFFSSFFIFWWTCTPVRDIRLFQIGTRHRDSRRRCRRWCVDILLFRNSIAFSSSFSEQTKRERPFCG